MKVLIAIILIVLLWAACSSGNGSPSGYGSNTANDGDCPEKTEMLIIQEQAQESYSPNGSRVTNSEAREIREAAENVPSDC